MFIRLYELAKEKKDDNLENFTIESETASLSEKIEMLLAIATDLQKNPKVLNN